MKERKILKYVPALMVMTLPFLMGKKSYVNRFREFVWSSGSYWMTDDFLICKAVALLLFTLLLFAACFLQWKRKKGSMTKHKIYGEWILYLACVVLSTVFSCYPTLSLLGANEQFEPVWILAAYIGCAFMTSNLLRTEKDREVLYRAAAFMALLMGIIGTGQFLVLKQKIYLTLYNPNYVGMMMAMILPVFYIRLWKKKEGKWKILYGAGTFGAGICLILSGSKGAVIVSAWLFALFFIQHYDKKRWSRVFLTGSLLAGVVFCIWLSAGNDKEQETFLLNVTTDEECVAFENRNGTLKFQFFMPNNEYYSFILTDEAGNRISYIENEEGTRYLPVDERFEDVAFTIADYDGSFGFLVEAGGREWYFARQENGEYGYMNGYFRLDRFQNAPHMMFAGRESFATNRGYIWSRTLPLLVKAIFLGTGPDTFAAVFPQNDIGKYLLTDMPYKMIVSRPHNFFLQTAVQTGMVSLIAMLSGFWRALRILLKNRGQWEPCAVAFSLCAYLASGMLYDSSLCTAPVFWLLFGAGVSICRELEGR